MTIKENISNIYTDLMRYGANKHTINSAVLAAEEIFLLYEKHSELDKNSLQNSWKYEVKRNPKRLTILLDIPGSSISPKALEEKDDIFILDNIVENSSFTLTHTFQKGINHICLTVEKYPSLLENFKFSYKFLGNNKRYLWLGMLFNIVAVTANVLTPAITGKIIISYTSNAFAQTISTALMLIIANTIYAITFGLASIYYNKTTYQMRGSMQTELMQKLFNVSDGELEKNGSGPFVKRINDDTMQISAGITSMLNIISNALYYLGVLVTSFLIDPTIFVAEIATFIILFALEKIRIYYLDIDRRKAIKAEDYHSGITVDYIRGAYEIKRINSLGALSQRMKDAAKDAADLNEEANTNTQKRSIVNNIVTYLGFFCITIYLGFAIYTKKLEIPEALVLFNYFSIVGMPLVMLIQRYMTFKKDFSISCERVSGLVSGIEFPFDAHGDVHLDKIDGNICVKDVSFEYNQNGFEKTSRTILKDINLSINACSMVGIVGKSGSGKSTLLKLISGQRQCTSGSVSIDGINILELDKNTLCKNIAIVNQSPYLFDTSIRNNLLFVKPDATEDELRKVCKKACILEDIEMTEKGFDTILGEKGVRFSNGQRQRIAIARALLMDSKIMLFDEATSAVDNLTQEKLKNTIEELRRDHTIIIISHRLSLLRNADAIYMISDGKIIASGNHDTLIEQSPEYRELYFADKTES